MFMHDNCMTHYIDTAPMESGDVARPLGSILVSRKRLFFFFDNFLPSVFSFLFLELLLVRCWIFWVEVAQVLCQCPRPSSENNSVATFLKTIWQGVSKIFLKCMYFDSLIPCLRISKRCWNMFFKNVCSRLFLQHYLQ